jgi:hypothetical protein
LGVLTPGRGGMLIFEPNAGKFFKFQRIETVAPPLVAINGSDDVNNLGKILFEYFLNPD